MSFVNRVRFSLATIVAALVVVPLAAAPASADGVKKYRDSDRTVSRKARRHDGDRAAGHADRRRDPAVFASQVDLSRPGGPERFFELLREENR